MKNLVAMVVLMGMLSVVALGDTIVDDHFDDGVIGTNTTGIGTGFNGNGIWGGQLTEENSRVKLATPNAGWEQSVIASKEAAAIGTDLAHYEFLGVSFAKNPTNWGNGTDRLILGVSRTNDATDGGKVDARDFPGPGPDTGFWVEFESNTYVAGSNQDWNGTSVFFYEHADDTRTVLATWTFDTLNWSGDEIGWNWNPILNIAIDLSSTGYSLAIDGDTISSLTGSLVGTYADAGININELPIGHAAAYEQCEGPGADLFIDQIIITGTVPEPATLILLGLGTMGLIRRKK